ncbi:flavin-containing monooxygenase [Streptomyces gilvus]|uniref:flavin-containing monooxygenase n=1 Tax=Streptomyces gilvus TaxID=2920937 RepID=UPI001F118E4F|nr:NAD(P)/FAD-dependent oxidoreductase [Streptomyces sp. CME 23]MCH5677953.1 NAD(P)/FAD-dependent oxidoreductase [Streptomyces sp. CME 23]
MTESFRGVEFDREAIVAKNAQEREKRFRADGNTQYVHLDEHSEWMTDPHTPRADREAVTRDVDVVILGAGFGAMLSAARLREAGVGDILLIDKGGDFGGTWYWNRYPGVACDVESYTYLPLLEETGYMPSEKYAHGDEIYAYSRLIARRFGLYQRALLQTLVEAFRWDDAISRWRVETDREDAITAKFIVVCPGHYRSPKLPGIPGVDDYAGRAFHTSRWDYAYTGGDSNGNLDKLADKVVGIIGTGATAVQVVPHLGKAAKEVFVFQRTPSTVDVRNDHPTDEVWFNTLEPGWQKRRMENFNRIAWGQPQDEDLVNDSWTRTNFEHVCRARGLSAEEMAELRSRNDFAVMEQIRRRVDEEIHDPAVADTMKPWYERVCKRPCFHDEFLSTFNRPNVHLVDTDGRGVDRITEKGVLVGDTEYPVDLLVYATGFDPTPYLGFPVPVYGRDGLSLGTHWKEGARTMHGIHVHHFPNMFIASTTQSAWASNFPHMLTEQAEHIAYTVKELIDRNVNVAEVTEQAEAEWVAHHEELAAFLVEFWGQCTPSHLNNEGHITVKMMRDGSYGGGVDGITEVFRNWREEGSLSGLQLQKAAESIST